MNLLKLQCWHTWRQPLVSKLCSRFPNLGLLWMVRSSGLSGAMGFTGQKFSPVSLQREGQSCTK